MYDDILVPTDGSDGSDLAVEHAIDVARKYDATIHTLYVVESGQVTDAVDDDTDVLEAIEEAGRRAVDDVVEQADDAGIETVQASVARGIPHDAILTYVEEYGVDLVVMATHGRSGFTRELLGSVTEKVVRSSPVPVLTVNIVEHESTDA